MGILLPEDHDERTAFILRVIKDYTLDTIDLHDVEIRARWLENVIVKQNWPDKRLFVFIILISAMKPEHNRSVKFAYDGNIYEFDPEREEQLIQWIRIDNISRVSANAENKNSYIAESFRLLLRDIFGIQTAVPLEQEG